MHQCGWNCRWRWGWEWKRPRALLDVGGWLFTCRPASSRLDALGWEVAAGFHIHPHTRTRLSLSLSLFVPRAGQAELSIAGQAELSTAGQADQGQVTHSRSGRATHRPSSQASQVRSSHRQLVDGQTGRASGRCLMRTHPLAPGQDGGGGACPRDGLAPLTVGEACESSQVRAAAGELPDKSVWGCRVVFLAG